MENNEIIEQKVHFRGLMGCNNQTKEKTMATSTNEKLVKEYFEHFNNHQ